MKDDFNQNSTETEKCKSASLSKGASLPKGIALPKGASLTMALNPHAMMIEEGIQIPWLNRLLGNTYVNFLMTTPTKIGVLLLYAGVLAGAFVGIARLEEGMDQRVLAHPDSYYHAYITKFRRDFWENLKPAIHVSVDETLDFTDQRVRADYNELIGKFRNNTHFINSNDYVISWLDRFLNALRSQSIDVDSLTMPEFIGILQREFFVADAYQYLQSDVAISSDNTSITASRFFVQTRELSDTAQKKMMLNARRIAADYKWDVKVFAVSFLYLDQYLHPGPLSTNSQAHGSSIGLS